MLSAFEPLQQARCCPYMFVRRVVRPEVTTRMLTACRRAKRAAREAAAQHAKEQLLALKQLASPARACMTFVGGPDATLSGIIMMTGEGSVLMPGRRGFYGEATAALAAMS